MDSVSEHKGSECRQHVDQYKCNKPQDQSALHLCLCSRTTQCKWSIEKPLFFVFWHCSGEVPRYGDKELRTRHAQMPPVHLKKQRKSPISNDFGTLPAMPSPSDHLLAPQDLLYSWTSLSTSSVSRTVLFSFLILFPPGGSWGRGCRWHSVYSSAMPSPQLGLTLLSAAHLPFSETYRILSDKDFTPHSSHKSPTVAVSNREAWAPACECSNTQHIISRLHHSIRLNETLN